jgi:hypothetical protein
VAARLRVSGGDIDLHGGGGARRQGRPPSSAELGRHEQWALWRCLRSSVGGTS